MKQIQKNPFVISGYVKPDLFCDRKLETEKIIKAVSSGRNLTLISLRRIGKTGLLKHVRNKLEAGKTRYNVIYTDLLPTMNGSDMMNEISNALIRSRKQQKSFIEKIISALGSLRPRLTVDNLTGQASLELVVENTVQMQSGLDKLFSLAAGLNRETVIMLDEFQQIRNYPEKNMEHILRTIIQNYPSVRFIFSGSSRHMLENMFLSADKPFYRSSEVLYLDKINADEYSKFITEKFGKKETLIDTDIIQRIFEWTRLHTWYVQYVCNRLYELDERKITSDTVNKVFSEILTDFEPEYNNYRNLLPSQQFRLLIAFASEGGVQKPLSGAFIRKYDLTSPSSVTTSLKALQGKEMIVNENGAWMVYDIFFSRWLEYHFGVAG